MKIQNTIVMGTGSLVIACAKAIREVGLPVMIYDTNANNEIPRTHEMPSSFLKTGAERIQVDYVHIPTKEFYDRLCKLTIPTLLVSAINPNILPGRVLANSAIRAVNCHQALLPRHPGRNAEMWAIYEGDQETGITWHELTAAVDGGGILKQKTLPITDASTSIQIFRAQIKLAETAFWEILPGLLNGPLSVQPQEQNMERSMHYSWEVPADGQLDLHWSGEQMSRFLRAMDYGVLSVVPSPELVLDGKHYHWKKYRIEETKEQKTEDLITEEAIIIWRPGKKITLRLSREG